MLSVPAPLADLGVSQELKSALLKLTAALPAARRPTEEYVRQRFYLDSAGWQRDEEAVPHLKTIHQAVWQDRKLHLTLRVFSVQVQKLVDPYGLVVKAGVWYLVCAAHGHIRVHRISYLVDARLADEKFERPADFDLAAYWQASCAELEQNRSSYSVTVRVAPDFVPVSARLLWQQRPRENRARGTAGRARVDHARTRFRVVGSGAGSPA